MALHELSYRLQHKRYFCREIYWHFWRCTNKFKCLHGGTQIKKISYSISFTYLTLTYFKCKSFEVIQMIVAWNQHTKDVFIPFWVYYFDESVSIWTNKFTCPGWMFVPMNAHPKVNYYHNTCCGESRIMYRWELVEGKDRTK